MKKFSSLLLLLFALALPKALNAQQKQVFIHAAVLSQPEDFHDEFHTRTYPGLELTAGYTFDIKTSNFIWECQLSYMNVQAEYKVDKLIPPMGGYIIDPHIPEDLTYRYVSSTIGMKAGIGYKISTYNEHSLLMVGGASAQIPFLSTHKSRAEGDDKWRRSELYTGDDFKYGILYGFYLKPTYQLKFKRNSPWALNIFGEANLLWRNQASNGNPLFMAGGGLGISYTLN